MQRLIVAGVPQGVYRRNKGYSPTIAGWELQFCPSKDHSRANLQGSLARLQQMADEADEPGAHILAFHWIEDERGELTRQFHARHRICWLETQLLRVYGQDAFTEHIARLAAFEDEWRSEIRPMDVKAPLMLPERCFVASGPVSDLWHRAQVVSISRDKIPAVRKLAERFTNTHSRSSHWIDERGIRFSFDGPRHGDHVPLARTWKYTFKVPQGFHYDVQHDRGGSFTILDHQHRRWNFKAYTNVDCHGVVRPGA